MKVKIKPIGVTAEYIAVKYIVINTSEYIIAI